MEEVFRGDGFSAFVVSSEEFEEGVDAIVAKISGDAEDARGGCKFQPGHRVAVTDGPWKGMYGKVIHISGCMASCFKDADCHVVYVTPVGNIPEGKGAYLYKDETFAARLGLPEDMQYISFRQSEVVHVD